MNNLTSKTLFLLAAAALTLASLFACKNQSENTRPVVPEPTKSNGNGASGSKWSQLALYCPGSSKLVNDGNLCAVDGAAVGPFTKAMQDECERFDREEVCQKDKLRLDLASRVRGPNPCMPGSSLNANALCEEDGYVYGPFPQAFVLICLRLKAKECETMRWATKTAAAVVDSYEANANLPNPNPVNSQPSGPNGGKTESVATNTNSSTSSSTQTSPDKETTQPVIKPEEGMCEYSWEEKPGYADYTTIDWYEKSIGQQSSRNFDRPQSKTLQGSGRLANMSICERARLLKPCFDKTKEFDKTHNAPDLYKWSVKRGLDYSLMRMAFAIQETNLGNAHDNCYDASCNGIGLMQIISAYASNGELLSPNDKRWDGIAFNILTNLAYSARIMQRKQSYLSANGELSNLAEMYNGNPNNAVRLAYARNVPMWYHDLEACKLP